MSRKKGDRRRSRLEEQEPGEANDGGQGAVTEGALGTPGTAAVAALGPFASLGEPSRLTAGRASGATPRVGSGCAVGPRHDATTAHASARHKGGAILEAVDVLVHVEARRCQALERGALVAVDDRVVGAHRAGVVVRLVLVGAGRVVGLVALDLDLGERGKVVAVGLDVVRVPVNHTTGPVDRALGVGLETTGPDRDLHARGRLREAPLVGRGVPGLGLFLGAALHAVDDPLDLVGGPANFVVVPVVVGVGQVRDVARVGVCKC